MSKPVLTFCIPTYNRAKRVYACVTHILQYPGDDIEVLVSNNASTDNTLALLSIIDDKRLSVYSNAENILANNWSLVASLAKGSFSAIMSDEDIVLIENLSKIVSYLKENPNLGSLFYPVKDFYRILKGYSSHSIIEGIILSIRHGGHITSVIVNTEMYKQYFYLPFKNAHDTMIQILVTLIAPMVIAINNKPIALITDSLCTLGEGECESNRDINQPPIVDDGSHFGIGTPTILQPFFTIIEVLKSMNVNNDDSIVIVKEIWKKHFVLKAEWNAILFCNRPSFTRSAHKLSVSRAYIQENKINPVDEFNEVNDKFYAYVKENMDYWNAESLYLICRSAINSRLNDPLPEGVSPDEAVGFGDIAFSFLRKIGPYMAGYEDFEMKETNEMEALISTGHYQESAGYRGLKTFRADFLRGQAYMQLADYENAEKHLKAFLSVAENPKILGDIVTGFISRIRTYSYLGEICEGSGRHMESLSWFSKAQKITDDYCLGEFL